MALFNGIKLKAIFKSPLITIKRLFPKYAEAETRRESTMHIHRENTLRIRAKS